MNESSKVTVMYFTDILCIWAYVAQIRVDELKATFGAKIEFQYHFIPVFGSVETRLSQERSYRGGASAYSQHVKDTASKFDHITVHPDIWVKNRPTTSISCHLFLKAIQLLAADENIIVRDDPTQGNDNLCEAVVRALRTAFFKDNIDISNSHAQYTIAEKLQLPLARIQHYINSGASCAALDRDTQLKEKNRVVGSPTFVLNEGRQIIYGNVGYRVIEANINELLNQPKSQLSWC